MAHGKGNAARIYIMNACTIRTMCLTLPDCWCPQTDIITANYVASRYAVRMRMYVVQYIYNKYSILQTAQYNLAELCPQLPIGLGWATQPNCGPQLALALLTAPLNIQLVNIRF
jgi:hypothetical protein